MWNAYPFKVFQNLRFLSILSAVGFLHHILLGHSERLLNLSHGTHGGQMECLKSTGRGKERMLEQHQRTSPRTKNERKRRIESKSPSISSQPTFMKFDSIFYFVKAKRKK